MTDIFDEGIDFDGEPTRLPMVDKVSELNSSPSVSVARCWVRNDAFYRWENNVWTRDA